MNTNLSFFISNQRHLKIRPNLRLCMTFIFHSYRYACLCNRRYKRHNGVFNITLIPNTLVLACNDSSTISQLRVGSEFFLLDPSILGFVAVCFLSRPFIPGVIAVCFFFKAVYFWCHRCAFSLKAVYSLCHRCVFSSKAVYSWCDRCVFSFKAPYSWCQGCVFFQGPVFLRSLLCVFFQGRLC